MRSNVVIAVSSSFLALAAASPAWAQAADETPAAAPAADADDSSSTEIIVTANKREQSLSKVGLTISAVGSEDLAKQRIADIEDLARIVPGLVFAPTLTSAPVYNLRGVGFYDTSLSSYPDVSVYIDQAPLPLPIMATLTAFDLERIEVLKGPQGTLFGNNATGGAVNFIAAKPTSQFSAGAQLSYGRFNTLDIDAFVSGPITDTLDGRIAIKAVNGDEWQRSYTRDDKLGKKRNIAGRAQLAWHPADGIDFLLNVNGWRDQNDPIAPQKIATTPQNAPGTAGLGGVLPADFPIYSFPNAPANARSTDWTPEFRPYADNRFFQTTLRADIAVTDDIILTSLTGYNHLNFLNATDTDGTPFVNQNTARLEGKLRSFTQEVRLANDAANSLRWVVGSNYEKTSADEFGEALYWDSSTTPINGIGVSHYEVMHDMRNYAGFANVEFDLSDLLTLRGGIRQTRAEHDAVSLNGDSRLYQTPTPFTLTQFFNQIYRLVYGGAVPQVTPFELIILDTRTNSDGTPVDPATYLKTGRPIARVRENSTSWSVGVDVKPTEDLLLYANISKGYKAGAAPTLAGSIYTAYQTVKQESILSYEAGAKASLLDGKISLSTSAFYYDYRNKQQKSKFVDPIFGGLDLLLNVPQSRIYGAELSVVAKPAAGLTFSINGTYLDAKVKEFEGVVGAAVDTNGLLRPVIASFAGVQLPFAPKLSYAARMDYEFSLSSGYDAFVGAGVTGQSKSIGILTLSPADQNLYEINARALIDANAGIRTADGRWTVSVWGKNVFNKYYWGNSIQSYDTVVRYPGRPAEYGVSVGVRF